MSFNLSKENLIETEKGKTLVVYWLKRIFIDDWLMKLVALVITLALWLGVTGLQASISRPLNNVALNPLLAKDLEITNEFVQEVDLEITGDKRKIDQINPRDLVVTYDITDLQAGEREVHLTSQDINIALPSGVTVTKIVPEKIILKIETVEQAEIPVRAETKDDPIEGYEVYNIKIIPEKVLVRGPKSFVESLNFVSTDEMDLSGRRGDFVAQKVPINIGDNKKISLVDSVTVTASFRIGKKRIERLFVIPYETENRKGNAKVVLYGADSILENLTTSDVEVVENSENAAKLSVILPAEIRSEIEVRSIEFKE